MTADRLGFDTGWVAQHHAGNEGGLPSPLVFLAAAARYTRRLTLATGIITLALENPVRLAEDAAIRPGQNGASGATAAHRPLGEAQSELVEAYLGSWSHPDITPRIGLSRSLYVAPTRVEAYREAEAGLRRSATQLAGRGGLDPHAPLADLVTRSDLHLGCPDDVIASLRADRLLPLATDLILQVHPAEPEAGQITQAVARELSAALGALELGQPGTRGRPSNKLERHH